MIYNNKKHFYDPYDSLDAEWKARISHEMLSVEEAAQLSEFSRQYINKLIANGIIDANMMIILMCTERACFPSILD